MTYYLNPHKLRVIVGESHSPTTGVQKFFFPFFLLIPPLPRRAFFLARLRETIGSNFYDFCVLRS